MLSTSGASLSTLCNEVNERLCALQASIETSCTRKLFKVIFVHQAAEPDPSFTPADTCLRFYSSHLNCTCCIAMKALPDP